MKRLNDNLVHPYCYSLLSCVIVCQYEVTWGHDENKIMTYCNLWGNLLKEKVSRGAPSGHNPIKYRYITVEDSILEVLITLSYTAVHETRERLWWHKACHACCRFYQLHLHIKTIDPSQSWVPHIQSGLIRRHFHNNNYYYH